MNRTTSLNGLKLTGTSKQRGAAAFFAVLAVVVLASLLFSYSTGDARNENQLIYYMESFCEPGKSARVRLEQGWGMLGSHLVKVTAASEELEMKDQLLYQSRSGVPWSVFESDTSLTTLFLQLWDGNPNKDSRVIDIPVPSSAAPGKKTVRFDVEYICARWASTGRYQNHSCRETVAFPIFVAPAGKGMFFKFREAGFRVFILLLLSLVCSVATKKVRNKTHGNEPALIFVFILWVSCCLYFSLWPLAGILGLSAHWMMRLFCPCTVLGTVFFLLFPKTSSHAQS